MISLKFKTHVQDEDIKALIKYQSQYTSIVHVFYRMLCKEKALKSEFYYLSKDSILLNKFDELNNVDLYKNSKWIVRCAIKEALSLVNKNKQICFGNKKIFNDYKKDKISKEELKARRCLPIYSIGTSKPYKGNRHFEILSDLKTIAFKPQRGIKFNIKLLSLSKKRLQILQKLFEKQNDKSISITYKLSKDYILISYEEDLIKPEIKSNKIKNRVMSIDLNPNYIGWSIVDWESSSNYTIIDSGTYSTKQINDIYKTLKTSSADKVRHYLHNKLEYETYQISKNLLDKALY